MKNFRAFLKLSFKPLKPIAMAMKMFRKLEPEPTKIVAQETDI